MSKTTPDQMAKDFFTSLGQLSFPTCWNLFTRQTQRKFLDWTLQTLYQRHEKAATQAKLGLSEVKFMFETNDPKLIQPFWRRFIGQSKGYYIAKYAYFDVLEDNGRVATIQARMELPNGQVETRDLVMVKELGGWKFGYFESGFPF
jgi:hypothetical protein